MKKLLISLMAVLFLGSLFALESDPSDVVGYIKYDIVTTAGTNLNFVTNALDAGYAMAGNLGDAITGCSTVNEWDETTQGWNGAINMGGWWLNDYAVAAGLPYMVDVTAASSFYSAGGLFDPIPTFTIITTAGTNLNDISLKLDKSYLTMAGAMGDEIGAVSTVNGWDAATQGWNGAINMGGWWLNDFAISLGDAFLIDVTAGSVWSDTPIPIAKKDNTVQLNK